MNGVLHISFWILLCLWVCDVSAEVLICHFMMFTQLLIIENDNNVDIDRVILEMNIFELTIKFCFQSPMSTEDLFKRLSTHKGYN